jgi:hypothetical protein
MTEGGAEKICVVKRLTSQLKSSKGQVKPHLKLSTAVSRARVPYRKIVPKHKHLESRLTSSKQATYCRLQRSMLLKGPP